jgi:parallel beta-helix repeat protein
MPGKRIPDLPAIAGASTANDDNLVIFDTDASTTKRILRSQLAAGLVGDLPYTPAGGISATTVPTAIAELDSEAAKSATLAAAGGAALIGNTPAGTIAATTVQGAINEIVSDLAVPTGSSLVGFQQSAVGAAVRTLLDKAREFVSVKDFICADGLPVQGDGVHDDTTGIQAAFNSADYLLFPPGTYVSDLVDVTKDIVVYGYGAKILHKANAAAQNRGLIRIQVDKKFVCYGMEFDGNAANQTATPEFYSFIHCTIGSMELYDCYVHDTKGHAIATGNVFWNFDSTKFAHDVVIQGCRIIQPLSNAGDCLRIERTRRGLFRDNYVYGGFSSMRSQLYCKDLKFINNESCYSFADVGITVALSENLEILDNNCHHNFYHGIEVDAVVNCRVAGNYTHNNGWCGIQAAQFGAAIFTNESRYWGSIAEGYGVNYSDQTYTSPQVPNINTSYVNNKIINNGRAVRLIGLEDDLFAQNYVSNGLGTTETTQLQLEGGSLLKTGSRIIDNIFVPGPTDTDVIGFASYQFTATISGNRVIGPNANKRFFAYGARGTRDINEANKYLLEYSKRSSLLTDIADTTSKTRFAVTHTSTGLTTYTFYMWGSGQGNKLVRVVGRVASGTPSLNIIIQLWNNTGSRAFVATLVNEATTFSSTYQEFIVQVPTSASVGNEFSVAVQSPSAGIQIFLSEINVYMADS